MRNARNWILCRPKPYGTLTGTRQGYPRREVHLATAWRCILIAFLAGWALETPGQMQNGRELVKASLLADQSAIRPGQTFRIGVRYQMAPGWHIYWRYPGDAGIPTKIDWKLPPGFET